MGSRRPLYSEYTTIGLVQTIAILLTLREPWASDQILNSNFHASFLHMFKTDSWSEYHNNLRIQPRFYLPLTEKALVTSMSSQALTDPTRLLTFGVEFE